MAVTQENWTDEQLMALPKDGHKRELVDGELVEMPAGYLHDVLIANLILLLGPLAKKLGYLGGASAGFWMVSGNLRCPDVHFMKKERLPEGPTSRFVEGAPDLAVEVISPSERSTDIFRKVAEYFESGSQVVWLVRPETQSVTVYRVDELESKTFGPEDTLDAGELLPGFKCTVSEIFDVE